MGRGSTPGAPLASPTWLAVYSLTPFAKHTWQMRLLPFATNRLLMWRQEVHRSPFSTRYFPPTSPAYALIARLLLPRRTRRYPLVTWHGPAWLPLGPSILLPWGEGHPSTEHSAPSRSLVLRLGSIVHRSWWTEPVQRGHKRRVGSPAAHRRQSKRGQASNYDASPALESDGTAKLRGSLAKFRLRVLPSKSV